MDSKNLKNIFFVAFALFFAIYLGISAATAQLEAIAWMVGFAGIVFVLAMGKHIWVIIPISGVMAGTVNALPGSPPAWWAAMAVVGVVFFARLAMRSREFSFRWSWLDFAILIQLIAIMQAWLRNPSGLALFGGDTVGGKSNIAFTFAIVCYALQAFVKTDMKTVKAVVTCMIGVTFIDAILMLSSNYFPFLSALILPFYSGVEYGGTDADTGVDSMSERVTGGKDIGQSFGLAAFALWPPLSTFNPLRPVRFIMMSLAVVFTLLSGFRSVTAWLAVVFAVSCTLREKFHHVVISAIFGFLLLALVVVTGQVRSMPMGAQRALSFLPVDVDPRIRHYAESSSEWRFEMWMLALTSDKYIKNKLLGDGFGFSSSEWAASADSLAGDKRKSIGMSTQEVMMIRGSFHGFHIETIRISGVFGLICALIGLGIMFKAAWVLIQHFKGRPEWGYILYIGIPFLIYPFWAMLVFGTYRSDMPKMIVAAGLLKILQSIRLEELAQSRAVSDPVRGIPNALAPSVRSLAG